MEPIVAVMLILGCDHSMLVCREAQRPIEQYVSVEACEADKDINVRFVDDYPMAVAECVKVPEVVAGQNVVIDWRLDAVRGLHAEARLRDTGQMTAEAKTIAVEAGGV